MAGALACYQRLLLTPVFHWFLKNLVSSLWSRKGDLGGHDPDPRPNSDPGAYGANWMEKGCLGDQSGLPAAVQGPPAAKWMG